MPNVLKLTRVQLAQKEQFLSVYALHLAAVLQVSSEISQHPWSWVAKNLSFEEEERLVDLLNKFVQTLHDAEQPVQILRETVGISLENNIAGLRAARELLDAVPAVLKTLNQGLLEPCRDPRFRAMLHTFVQNVGATSATLQVLREFTAHGHTQELIRDEVIKQLAFVFDVMSALRLEKRTYSELRALLDRGASAEITFSETGQCFSALQALCGFTAPFDAHSIELLLNYLQLIESAPFEVLHLRFASLETDGVAQVLHNAADQARALRETHEELTRRLDLSWAIGTANPSQLTEHAKTLEEAGILHRWFGGKYRRARRTHRRIALTRQKITRTGMARDFRALADYCNKRTQFENQAQYRETFGPHFTGLETKWDEIRMLVGWYEEVFTLLPEHDQDAEVLRQLLLKARTERLKALKEDLKSHGRNRAALKRLQLKIEEVIDTFSFDTPHQSVQELAQQLRMANSQLEKVMKVLALTDLRDDTPVARIPDLLGAAEKHRTNVAQVFANDAVRQLLGVNFEGLATDLGPIEDSLAFAEAIAGARLPQKAMDWILCQDCIAHVEELRSWLSQAASYGDTLLDLGTDISTLTASTLWPAHERESFDALRSRAEKSLANPDELPRWVHFIRIREQSQAAGLDRLTTLADSSAMEPQHLVPSFRFLFYNSLARSIFAEYPDLSQFSGLTQERVREQFAQADKKGIQLYRERAASIIDRRVVPYGNQSGPVGSWTNLALITHEINKQKRHIPIRQLVRRAGHALQALTPCFMMGPLSVAQYLPPGRLRFDLVVMDEASQLKPEDAIGAIARGGQLVVVGDPKQLPPTSFFQRLALDADNDSNDTVVEEGESILDVTATLYQPVRRLRWHYRSRHHSLIAFSNREFYQSNLVIFPSAYRERDDLGVKYRPINGGVFENHRNPREAEVLVEAVLEHMQNSPTESLGVVTLNLEQRELVEEMLDHKLRLDPFAAAYQELMNNGPEPFFVKNLENVQGDERDVIFISVTYGPDARGNQYQRFGPITNANGHRRLNVLFTRAKKRVVVFSSLNPDKLQVAQTSAWGVRALKEYLIFARDGVLDSAEVNNAQPTNDFERSVGGVLKEKGFDVIPQVGVAGFFIDLGVRHPRKYGTFILGIECDGAGYHSGRSARDRDRLRQEILENLGWKIHRIWSTDWFKSRDTEIQRLLKRLGELLEADPDYATEVARERRTEALRQRLADLREQQIRPLFPIPTPRRVCCAPYCWRNSSEICLEQGTTGFVRFRATCARARTLSKSGSS